MRMRAYVRTYMRVCVSCEVLRGFGYFRLQVTDPKLKE